jgi:hypothetical protein
MGIFILHTVQNRKMVRQIQAKSISHTVRVKSFLLLLSLVGGCSPIGIQAAEIPANSTIADSFNIGGARQTGNPLKGSSTEIGSLAWKVLGEGVIRADGVLTTGNTKSVVASVPLAPEVQQSPFKVQIDCQPTTADWVGVALGSELNDFFKNARIILFVRPSGNFTLFAGNNADLWKKPLLQGKSPKYDSTGWNTLQLELDPVKKTLSAVINGEDVLRNKDLGEAFPSNQIQVAGVRINESATMQANSPAVDNFAVTLLGDTKPAAQTPVAKPVSVTEKKTETAVLQPVNQTQFFFNPNQPEVLKWKVQEGTTELNYEVRDYNDKAILSRTVDAKNGEIQLPLQLGAGFYEIRFEQTKQRFGVVVSTPAKGTPDKFFAIDGALSWLETRPQMRNELIAILKRSGIGVMRERLSWSAINPETKKWDWETNRQFDTLRQEYKKQGIEVLDLFHSAPNWAKIESSNPYPQRLVETKESWQEITKRWGDNWAGLEVWNEPDIDFGGELPADQYLPVVKTINYAFSENQVKLPIGGGVFAYFNPGYIQNSVKNGLLDQVDFVSFHTYAKAPSMEQIIGDYRRALTVQGQTPVPLWLTESGQPWKSGTDRPETGEDTTTALDIAMKAIESRACGIERYFSFVYPYYVEGARNFGMMGKEVSPLRSMASYVQSVAALSNTNYVGDLKLNSGSVQRARVFAQGDNAVVVLYSENPNAKSSVAWNGPVSGLQGIDGRPLSRLQNGAIPLPDGLTYVRTSLKALTGLVRQTPATQLTSIAKSTRKARPIASAVVLQPLLPSGTQNTKRGYKVEASALKSFPFKVRLNNLSKATKQVKLNCTVNGVKVSPENTTNIAALGTTEVQWNIDLASALNKSGVETIDLNITGTDQSGIAISPLSLEIFSERDLPTNLRLYPASSKLGITDLKSWKPNISGTGQMKMDAVDGAWQLETTFKGGDRWVYPDFKLPKNSGIIGSQGIVLRARAMAPSTVRLMIREQSGSTYFTPFSIIPPDDQWHSVVLRWQDLAALPSAPPDPNGKLDLDQISSISIGMNSKSDENTLEISDLYLARKVR